MSNNPNTSFKIASEDEFRSDAKGLAAKLNAVAANPNQLMSGGDVPWSTGLFDCGPANLCALTCLCPCITFGRTHSRLSKSGNLDDYSCCNLACCAWCVAAHLGLHCVPNLLQRNDIKDKGHLQGNFVVDFFKAWCCTCCDLIQQEKEAEHLLGNNVVMNQPTKVQGMNYGAQNQASAYPQQHP